MCRHLLQSIVVLTIIYNNLLVPVNHRHIVITISLLDTTRTIGVNCRIDTIVYGRYTNVVIAHWPTYIDIILGNLSGSTDTRPSLGGGRNDLSYIRKQPPQHIHRAITFQTNTHLITTAIDACGRFVYPIRLVTSADTMDTNHFISLLTDRTC